MAYPGETSEILNPCAHDYWQLLSVSKGVHAGFKAVLVNNTYLCFIFPLLMVIRGVLRVMIYSLT